MNKELVSKPYAAINRVKEELSKEQHEIVNIIKKNNDKYLGKIGEIQTRVDEVLTDTKTLQDQLKKRIKSIGADLESTRKFRE